MIAAGFIEARHQMRAAGPGGSAADGEISGEFRLTGRRECRAFFMADANPFDIASADRVGKGIERVPDQPEYVFDSNLFERGDQNICNRLRHLSLPWSVQFMRPSEMFKIPHARN